MILHIVNRSIPKFKFKVTYSHLFNYNTTTIRKKKEEIKKQS